MLKPKELPVFAIETLLGFGFETGSAIAGDNEVLARLKPALLPLVVGLLEPDTPMLSPFPGLAFPTWFVEA